MPSHSKPTFDCVSMRFEWVLILPLPHLPCTCLGWMCTSLGAVGCASICLPPGKEVNCIRVNRRWTWLVANHANLPLVRPQLWTSATCVNMRTCVRTCSNIVHTQRGGILALEEVAEDTRTRKTDVEACSTAMLLHGLLGAGRNWRSFAKDLAKQSAENSPGKFQVWLADLRNHGKTAQRNPRSFAAPHDIDATAADVRRTVQDELERVPDVLIGHSLSGKVVLDYLRKTSGTHEAPEHAWILDSLPGVAPERGNANQDVSNVLAKLATLPQSVPSRNWLYRELQRDGFSEELSLWMGSNLRSGPAGSKGGLVWSFHLEGVIQMYDSYLKGDYWDVLEDRDSSTTIHVVRAERSDRWDEQTLHRLEDVRRSNPLVQVHVLPNAGHWLHTDNPQGLKDLIVPTLVHPANAG